MEDLGSLPSAAAHPVQPADYQVPYTSDLERVRATVALEVEQWKATEKEKHRTRLKQKEEEHIHKMEMEAKRRIAEQEAAVAKKKEDIVKVEEKLKKLLADLEKREQKVTAGKH